MDGDRNVGLAQSFVVCRKKTARKLVRLVLRILVCMITAGLLLLSAALVGVRLLGLTPYTLQMLSAAPGYRQDALLYVRRVKFADIREGDTAIYVAEDPLEVVACRVLAVDYSRWRISTGDASGIEEGRILGVVAFSVPWLGAVSVWLTGSTAKLAAASLFAVLLAIFFIEYDPAGNVKV